MDEGELRKALNRMGNDVFQLIALARNLGIDYSDLVRLLGGEKTLREGMGFSETLDVVHRDKDGNILGERHIGPSPGRCLTNVGFAEVAGLLLTDVGGTAFDYIAIGTGTTAEAATDTALVAETHRAAGTGTRVTVNVTNDTAQLTYTFSGYATTEAITESGVFNAATGGTLLCRKTFSALNINFAAGDSLAVTWKITVKQAT
jgi:hypothetical protein